MPNLSLSKRLLWVAVTTVASPLALLYFLRSEAPSRPLDVSVANDDLYADLFDGQMN